MSTFITVRGIIILKLSSSNLWMSLERPVNPDGMTFALYTNHFIPIEYTNIAKQIVVYLIILFFTILLFTTLIFIFSCML